MSDIPKLVQDDPWLEPQAAAIVRRTAGFENALKVIQQDHGSLAAYSMAHQCFGIRFDPEKNHWIVREWLPAAKAVSLIGEFNEWNREAHRLEKSANGIWELKISAETLKHGDEIKLHIHGADDSQLDRLPATITRAVQNPETHDFTAQIWLPPQPYRYYREFKRLDTTRSSPWRCRNIRITARLAIMSRLSSRLVRDLELLRI